MKVHISKESSATFPTYHATDSSASATPTAFAADTDYFVVNATATTFQLSETL